MRNKGMVHLYVGDGKGKTTATVGLAVRALGQDNKVLFCQFLKSGKSGEISSLEKLGAEIITAKHGTKFTFEMNEEELEESRNEHINCLAQIEARLESGDIDLVILDEIVDAVNAKIIDLPLLIAFIKNRPENLEVVLSGRNPAKEIQDIADYHTNFVCVSHPYQKGVIARRGVEF